MARYFTSPLKLFDYMAAGAPIVASDLPTVREVLTDGDNALLVPPGRPVDALAAAIRRLLVNPGLADRLRRTAFEQVRGVHLGRPSRPYNRSPRAPRSLSLTDARSTRGMRRVLPGQAR